VEELRQTSGFQQDIALRDYLAWVQGDENFISDSCLVEELDRHYARDRPKTLLVHLDYALAPEAPAA
jgi:hypothetical protein